ncbi:hypothetical protein EJ03DRAFT_271728 [Teratosphaeria nubilosa]|uniref:Glycosyltransferase family 25 protein n=1 Tax=Teratosphaeria nubilosa TaxID=161662 RepID=A0A6G1LAX4_9PEZI|nr:hypothetical protein EJ03DRAFT_271728 [Teratosphaeria nubilosa]
MERRRVYVAAALVFLLVLLWQSSDRFGRSAVRFTRSGGNFLKGVVPANSTLGFSAVYAVSRAGSPRREGLLFASNITEIEITIPEQPQWSDEDVNSLRAEKNSAITRGSALAWLGHLNALRSFVESDLETVLILEDDVDWDIHLRTTQIPAAAAAVRQLIADHSSPGEQSTYDSQLNNYWGNSSSWDIIYLGHCGDIFKPDAKTFRIPKIEYYDPTLPSRQALHPYTSEFLDGIGVPEHTRVVHQSVSPLCTFGFALTRPAAHRLLTEIAHREASGGTMAYDVRILEACRDLGLRCWSANPELFHHLELESEIAIVNGEGDEGEGQVDADESATVKVVRLGSAPNIACGARSDQFFTRDPQRIEYLKEVVGREGKCIRDQEEERGTSVSR